MTRVLESRSGFVEGAHDFADAPVEFGHHVAVDAARGFAAEAFGGSEGDVRVGMREVEEERGALGVADEFGGCVGVLAGEGGEVGGLFLDLFIAEEDAGRHVVAVGDAEVVVEAAFGGEVFGLRAEVPLTHALGAVALRLEKIGEGLFVVIEAGLVGGEEDAGDADTGGVAAGEEGGAGGGADGVGRGPVGEADAFGGELIDVGGGEGGAVAVEVAVAEVVGVDEDDVGGRG